MWRKFSKFWVILLMFVVIACLLLTDDVVALLLALKNGTVWLFARLQKPETSVDPKPNIVFILTDDQDVMLGGMTPMAKTKKFFDERGINFYNSFTTVPICCPSRASILTGLYQHNHKVLNNSRNGNCYGSLWKSEHETKAFVTYLKQQNYTTFFAGKYLNTYGFPEKNANVPPGWDHWNGLVGNSVYYNYNLSVNGSIEMHANSTSDYLTDLINMRATKFLETHASSRSPFFMLLSTPACHSPFQASQEYINVYQNVTAPRTPNFNMSGGPNKHWLLRQTPDVLPEDSVQFLDGIYGKRWDTLLSVDDILENIVNILSSKELLENTYIFYTSDNGYHLGQFSLPFDKRQMYEFDVRVPLYVAGPLVKNRGTRQEPVVNVDLAPTFLELAGVTAPTTMDGRSLVPLFANSQTTWRTELLIEYCGEGRNPGEIPECPQYNKQGGVSQCWPHCICEDAFNNTFSCVRTITLQKNIIHCHFHDNENFVEVYDLNNDPWQLHNLASVSPNSVQHLEASQTVARLNKCQGPSCHH